MQLVIFMLIMSLVTILKLIFFILEWQTRQAGKLWQKPGKLPMSRSDNPVPNHITDKIGLMKG